MSYWDKYRSNDPRRIPPLEAPSFLSEGTPSFRAVVNHSGRFWFSMYRFNVSNGAPPLVPA